MSINKKKPDTKIKSRHPFDVWPPPRKKKQAEEGQEKAPRNVSYRDPEEYLDVPPEPIYDTEVQKEVEPEGRDDEEEKDAETK